MLFMQLKNYVWICSVGLGMSDRILYFIYSQPPCFLDAPYCFVDTVIMVAVCEFFDLLLLSKPSQYKPVKNVQLVNGSVC